MLLLCWFGIRAVYMSQVPNIYEVSMQQKVNIDNIVKPKGGLPARGLVVKRGMCALSCDVTA